MVRYDHLPLMNKAILVEDFKLDPDADKSVISFFLALTEKLPPPQPVRSCCQLV